MIQAETEINFVGAGTRLRTAAIPIETSLDRDGIVPVTICLLVAITPLVFAVRLFEPYIAPKEILVQAGTATVALIWLVSTRAGLRNLPHTRIWIPLFALTLIGVTSSLWSVNPAVSIEKAQYLATYVLLFAFALSAMRTSDARSSLTAAIMLAGGIEAVYVLLQYLIGDPIFAAGDLAGKWQTFGTLGNPNWTGEFLAVAALVSLGRLAELYTSPSSTLVDKRFYRHLTAAGFILTLLALAATLARGAWLAFVIGAIAFVAMRRSNIARVKLKAVVLPLAAASVATVVFIVVPLVSNPEAINHLFNVKSMNGRIWMSAVTSTMIRDAPLTGHGLGTFGLQFPLYQAQAFAREWSAPFVANASFTSYAHNDYLQLWAELGVFGFIAFLTVIWFVLRRGHALAGDPVALGCWAAVISILVNAAVAFPLHLPTTLMLFVVLIGVLEAAASKRTVGLATFIVPKRIAVALVILFLSFSAYRFSYDRYLSDAALWRANASSETGQLDGSENDIQTAIRYAPTRMEPFVLQARLFIAQDEYDQALASLDEAQKLGFDVQVFDLKATALNASGQRDAAISTLNELIRLRPDLKWPHQRLAALATTDP